MATITIGTIIAARNILLGVSDKLPFNTAIKIARFVKSTDEVSSNFDKKIAEIGDRYSAATNGGKDQDEEALASYAKGRDALLNEPMPDDFTIAKFTPEELKDIAITAQQAYYLMELVEQ